MFTVSHVHLDTFFRRISALGTIISASYTFSTTGDDLRDLMGKFQLLCNRCSLSTIFHQIGACDAIICVSLLSTELVMI